MRFWWLIPVVLAVVAIATVVGWLLARRAGVRSGKKGWVANTGYLRGLPKYQALVRRTRASLAIAFVCFLIAVIATSVSAGAPVDRYADGDLDARGVHLALAGLMRALGTERTGRDLEVATVSEVRELVPVWPGLADVLQACEIPSFSGDDIPQGQPSHEAVTNVLTMAVEAVNV